jgi:hypothetical protein
MAKKVVATLQKAGAKNLAKFIRSTKSPKTGAYTFQEEILTLDQVKEILENKSKSYLT